MQLDLLYKVHKVGTSSTIRIYCEKYTPKAREAGIFLQGKVTKQNDRSRAICHTALNVALHGHHS